MFFDPYDPHEAETSFSFHDLTWRSFIPRVPLGIALIWIYAAYFLFALDGHSLHFTSFSSMIFNFGWRFGWPFFLAALFFPGWRGHDSIVTSLVAWLIAHTIISVLKGELIFCPASLISLYPWLGIGIVIGHSVGRFGSFFMPARFQESPHL